MESGDNVIQYKSHSRPSSFYDCGFKCDKKGFNTPPFQCGWDRRSENIVQCILVSFIH